MRKQILLLLVFGCGALAFAQTTKSNQRSEQVEANRLGVRALARFSLQGRAKARTPNLDALVALKTRTAFQTASKVVPLSASEAALKECPLHGTALTTEDVPIFYGYGGVPIPAPGYFEAQKRLFPYFHLGVAGGCEVSKDSPTFQAVKFCPKCRAAEKRWLAAHRRAGFIR